MLSLKNAKIDWTNFPRAQYLAIWTLTHELIVIIVDTRKKGCVEN